MKCIFACLKHNSLLQKMTCFNARLCAAMSWNTLWTTLFNSHFSFVHSDVILNESSFQTLKVNWIWTCDPKHNQLHVKWTKLKLKPRSFNLTFSFFLSFFLGGGGGRASNDLIMSLRGLLTISHRRRWFEFGHTSLYFSNALFKVSIGPF